MLGQDAQEAAVQAVSVESQLRDHDIHFVYQDHEHAAECTEPECCCSCESHFEVTAHCLHVKHDPPNGCNCGTPMGFYVCTVFADMGEGKQAQISGAHGLCECYSRRKSEEK